MDSKPAKMSRSSVVLKSTKFCHFKLALLCRSLRPDINSIEQVTNQQQLLPLQTPKCQGKKGRLPPFP